MGSYKLGVGDFVLYYVLALGHTDELGVFKRLMITETRPGPKLKDSYLPVVTEEEVIAFQKAVDEFRSTTGLRFPTLTQYLQIAKTSLCRRAVVHLIEAHQSAASCGVAFESLRGTDRYTYNDVDVTCLKCLKNMEMEKCVEQIELVKGD